MVNIDDYGLTYEENDEEEYEIDLVNSDLASVRMFVDDVFSEDEEDGQGKMISYMFGANVDDLDQVVDYMMDSEIEEQVSKEDVFNLMESNRDRNLAKANNAASDSLTAIFITQLMAFKYVFDLDYSDSDVNLDTDEYCTDLSLSEDELRKETYNNLAKLTNVLDNTTISLSIGKDKLN